MASLIPFLFLIIPFLSLSTPLVNGQAPSESPTSSATASSPSSSAAPAPSSASPAMQKICSITKYPDVCTSSLGGSTPTPPDVVKNAITVAVTNTLKAQVMVTDALNGAGKNVNLSQYSVNCLEELSNSMFRLQSSINGLPSKTKDARAWMSAALVYQSDCLSNFKNVNDTVEINKLLTLLDSLTRMTSNALTLVRAFDLFGSDTGKWVGPKTERDGFFEPVENEELDFPTKFPTDLKVDATVSKDGTGFKTVGEAVEAAPVNLTGGKRFVINIKAGTYDEIVRVPLDRTNIVFIGDGIGKTIITGKMAVGPVGVFTYNTATVAVMGDGFMAKDLTIKNEAGIPTKQAVAFRSDSDKSYVENCEFIGHQDTLYIHGLRQFYKSCRVEGNVDFIFGNGAAYFKDCEIFINPRQELPEKGEKNAVTAQARTDAGQSTGFVFDNCSVTGTPEYMKLVQSNPKVHKNYLGRPWKEFARTVFIRSFLDSLILPAGWLEWDGNQSLSTLYYGEFENKGPGSDLKGRVPWSSQITPQRVPTFSVQNFLQGDEWLPKS
ncbi:Plant invertase/pectin methylesterase inhibitor superfamily [Euphorbia peplus]|nr:Plant invertase/pectin methylesterase inhibitor superfamily [Euphorbia peplus]